MKPNGNTLQYNLSLYSVFCLLSGMEHCQVFERRETDYVCFLTYPPSKLKYYIIVILKNKT